MLKGLLVTTMTLSFAGLGATALAQPQQGATPPMQPMGQPMQQQPMGRPMRPYRGGMMTVNPMAPPPALQQLQPIFSGRWICAGRSALPALHTLRARTTFAVALDGHFLTYAYREQAGRWSGAARAYFGYDPTTRQYRQVFLDNMGSIAVLSSSGWNGDQLVYTGPIMDDPRVGQMRQTFTRLGPHHVTVQTELSPDGMSWTTVNSLSCRR